LAPPEPPASAATTARSVEARRLAQAERASHCPVQGKTAFQFAMEKNDEQRGEPIYIGNAGLVLTNPFLPHLFQTLDLLTKDDDGRPRLRSDALSRAVHLLQYLVDDRTSAPELLLVLNKILCGVPTQTPVAQAIAPTDDEQALCQRLLGSMIANWTIIANTSIACLRETFLQREGMLQRTADGWKLRVDRKTVDVLVDQIPWSISTTYHPWMPQPLLVTW
jgi:hypothetical protein